ncbi:leucine carboxyl methyltransferase [Fistulina hepatica ATCC 64428]|uniref:Leucine carboxyl methyltransferase 1 n=1 Tax=Fistulina hepatica ATCC 64428 TaxID=1128425 RepID=A0A0D7ALB4_9AGAR|nr:leucine carboxyl methyltransferase [Fistulina hepatica ATCC 64428]
MASADPDTAIRQTDGDAAAARWSACLKGYLDDPFCRFLTSRSHLLQPRPPIINIGTYVRTAALDKLIDRWISLATRGDGQPPCQIVSFGAGSDTRFWRLATGMHGSRIRSYIELDFVEVTTKKAMQIKKSRELSSVLRNAAPFQGGTGITSDKYHLLPVDLRRPPAECLVPLTNASVDGKPMLSPELPTLLLFECVLAYMSPEASAAVIQWCADYVSAAPLGGIVYEMFGLQDPFGAVMLRNLQVRNITLPGAAPYPDVASLPNRFLQHGFHMVHARTLKDIRANHIEPAELERISQVEFLDEIEELDLVLAHYAITWGIKLPPVQAENQEMWNLWTLDTFETEEE